MASGGRAQRAGSGFLSAILRLLLAWAFVAASIETPANAQSEVPVVWVSPAGPGGTFQSPYEACQAQWQMHAAGASRFMGLRPQGDNWTFRDCEWTRGQWLCPQETNWAGPCTTVLPGYVQAVCPSGTIGTRDGYCRIAPGPERPCNCPDDGRENPTVGNPIVLATGAKVRRELDYQTADGGLSIGRSYRSFQVGRPIDGVVLPRSQPRGLAPGWNFDFAMEVQLGALSGSPSAPNAKVAVLMPDGSGYGFVLQSNGSWVEDPGAGEAFRSNALKLEFVGSLPQNLGDIRSASSNWKLTDRDDNVWSFQTFRAPQVGTFDIGMPTRMVARSGYTLDFAYNADTSLASITDSFGRTATFAWHQHFTTSINPPPSGLEPYPTAVKSIALPDGTSLQYSYDPPPAVTAPSTSVIKRLVKMEHRSASNAVLDSVSYLYEDTRFPAHLTGVIDHRNVRVSTYAYDAAGRAILTQGAAGQEKQEVAYGTNGSARTRTVTNPLGKQETYTFGAFSGVPDDYRLTQMAAVASPNTPAATRAISYGTDTFLAGRTDAEGRSTVTQRDFRGRPTSIVEASGTPEARTTTIAYDAAFNVPVTITRPGLTETRTYNSTGQLLTVTQTDTTSHSAPYATNGQTRTWTYAWNAAGQLLSVNGPLAPDGQSNDDVTRFTYSAGNLLTATGPLGHVTTYGAHDAGGRPGTMTDPNGVVTAFTYDALGRAKTITAVHPSNPALNATTTFDYDDAGNVTGITSPSTDQLILDYDAQGRMVTMRAASGERWDYEYDAMGNVTAETVRRGNGSLYTRVTRTFDELGRLIREASGTPHTARLGYDKVDNLTSSTTANGDATTTSFDALDRVIGTVAPDTGVTTLAYDASDNLLSHTDPIGVTTQFVYNGFGDAIREISPDRGTSTFWYDAAGAVVQASDGRGQVVVYTRDHLGRVTQKVPQNRPASETVTYTWDTGGLSGSYGVGRLGQMVDSTGTTQFRYDHRGNLLAKQQTIGLTTSAQLAYEYDAADRITQITYPSGRQVAYGYDSNGRVNSVQTRAGASGAWTTISSGYSYEPFGAVAGMALGNGLSVATTRGSDGRLASRRLYRTSTGVDLSSLTYRHNPDGNIAAIIDNLDDTRSALYGYDGNGRLVATATDGSVASRTYNYTSGTNQLASLTDSAGTRTIAYDGRGNASTENRPGSVTAGLTYDGYGRLTGYTRSDVGANLFGYNGLDDRVVMDLATAGMRRFVYDADGRVLGEYGTSASDVKAEFIWALPSVGSAGAFGGDDGLGGYMPLAVAAPDASATIELRWIHGNHLGVPIVTTDIAGNQITAAPGYLAPGFPGQSRVFADLYYNRYRDYDPDTGRYVQADPIGLRGGSNLYGYASANPVNVSDPSGLNPVAAVRGAAGVGAGVGEGLAIWCRANPVACMETIGPAAIRIASVCNKIVKYFSDSGDPDCEPRYQAMRVVVDELRRRYAQFMKNEGNLPEQKPSVAHPRYGFRNREGEAQQFYQRKIELRKLIAKAIAAGCTDIPPEAIDWAGVHRHLGPKYKYNWPSRYN